MNLNEAIIRVESAIAKNITLDNDEEYEAVKVLLSWVKVHCLEETA